MTDLFEYAEGRQARDQGMAKVLEHNPTWLDRAIEMLPPLRHFNYWEGNAFTGEQLRRYLQDCQVTPTHPNGWGALVSTLAKRGIIEKTGEYVQMKQKSSHARETALWRFV